MIRHHNLTLTGSAQQLSSIVGSLPNPIRTLSIQPDGANGNPVYLGGPGVSSSDYGVRMEAGATGVPPAPLVLGEFGSGWVRLEELYVFGTAAQSIHLLVDYFV
jgi:hypothetical protein